MLIKTCSCVQLLNISNKRQYTVQSYTIHCVCVNKKICLKICMSFVSTIGVCFT
uniref:Uncharacterized protein n=1 Tax=Anguilla anguilla TaxID=7936 RepID=A0A0E9XH89_ANGAN